MQPNIKHRTWGKLRVGILTALVVVFTSGNMFAENGGGSANRNAPAPTYKTEIAAINAIALQLDSQLSGAGVQTIFVRHFRGPGTNELQITNLLSQKLDDKFEVGPGGAEIEGRVRPIPGTDNGPATGYRISVDIEGVDGMSLPGASVDVVNDIEANIKLKESGAVRPQPPKKQGELVQPITLKKPRIKELIVGTRVYAHPDSPYSMEILVKDQYGDYQPRTPTIRQGAIVVNLERGETYKVRTYNDSIYESFANLNIDGLGRFALSHDPDQRRNIDLVKPKKSRDFVGYYLTPSQAASFMVGSYEDSVAKRILGDAPDIGTISVAFGCTWTGNNIPSFEQEIKNVQRQRVETVQVPKTITVPRTITEQVQVPVTGGSGNVYSGDGKNRTRTQTRMETRQRTVYETKTIMVPEQRTVTYTEQQVVGTTDGPAVSDNVNTVSRKFGLTRAVIKVRYFATK